MKEALERKLEKGKEVYQITTLGGQHYGIGGVAAIEQAFIAEIRNDGTFITATSDIWWRTHYSLEDYGTIVFDKKEDAEEAVSKLPRPGTTIYVVSSEEDFEGIYTRKAIGIEEKNNSKGCKELKINLESKAHIPISEIGKTLFINESDAIASISNKRNNK